MANGTNATTPWGMVKIGTGDTCPLCGRSLKLRGARLAVSDEGILVHESCADDAAGSAEELKRLRAIEEFVSMFDAGDEIGLQPDEEEEMKAALEQAYMDGYSEAERLWSSKLEQAGDALADWPIDIEGFMNDEEFNYCIDKAEKTGQDVVIWINSGDPDKDAAFAYQVTSSPERFIARMLADEFEECSAFRPLMLLRLEGNPGDMKWTAHKVEWKASAIVKIRPAKRRRHAKKD